MRYIINEYADITFDESGLVTISKGVWNYEEIVIELESESVKDEAMQEFLYKLSNREDIVVERSLEGEVAELFEYLISNDFLEKSVDEKRIDELLQEKKILFVVSGEFFEAKSLAPVLDVNAMQYEELIRRLEMHYTDADCIDAYDLNMMCEKAECIFAEYEEIHFLIKRPNVERLKILSLILRELEKVNSYSLIDNGMLFHFTCIPYKSPCFHCFHLRIASRLEGGFRKRRFITEYMRKHHEKSFRANKKTFDLFFVYQLVLKMLLDDRRSGIKQSIGSVLIWNINTMEVTNERLYKVPFCEGC